MASSGNSTIQGGSEPQRDDSAPRNNEEAFVLGFANTENAGSSTDPACIVLG